ncbi:hypothetical protein D623_10034248 [Myotis brandtii]|uniref:Uncharacterized protein n=1 Tax=Myotis brandtii TaxID=109478 RepID=S7QD43_MYOBR|nr:hypothetical protein D623_10034248 [Myotis brandtii]
MERLGLTPSVGASSSCCPSRPSVAGGGGEALRGDQASSCRSHPLMAPSDRDWCWALAAGASWQWVGQDHEMKAWLSPLPCYNTQNSNALVFTCCPNDADTVQESKHRDIQENPDIQCLRLRVNIRECQGAPEEGEKIPSG